MGIFFTAGENKIRPGIYQRYENRGTGPLAAAVNGIVAAVYRSNWGPVGAVESIGADEAGTLSARLGGGAAATVDLVTEAFQGGATTVLAVRLGSGGTPGGMTLKDTTTDVPADAVCLTARCPGSRSFKITIREKLDIFEQADYYAAVYCSRDFFQSYTNLSELKAFDKWEAAYTKSDTGAVQNGLWQYSSTNALDIAGFGKRLDCDVSYKDYPAIMRRARLNGF